MRSSVRRALNPEPRALKPRLRILKSALATLAAVAGSCIFPTLTIAAAPHNVIIFVADGLRHDSVNAKDAPTLFALRERGVHFTNSHSLFPTLTTPNASAIATGHYFGDTGDFSNTEYVGYPVFNHGDFGKTAGTPTPFLENDLVLGDLAAHVAGGNFLNEESLLALARRHGFNTAAIGKQGPVGIQDATQLKPVGGRFVPPQTLILDDSTGSPGGVPLGAEMQQALEAAGLGHAPTAREQPAGTASTPGTLAANVGQQKWFADAATKAVLPMFARNGRPFVLLLWSRDPDGTQHNEGDSLNRLQPGINGVTSHAAIANADANLRQLLDYLDANPALRDTTDVFVTSDHGFATISRYEIDVTGHGSQSYSTTFTYTDSNGKPDVVSGWLPAGFLAIDLAHALKLPLFDPNTQDPGVTHYLPVDPTRPSSATSRQHPASGNGLLGGTGAVQDVTDAQVIVTVSGGTDLIFLTRRDRKLAGRILAFLAQQDYVGCLFVDPSFGSFPGALPLTAVSLDGSARMPRPTIVVSFKSFLLTPGDLLSAVQVSDATLQEGQGTHGGFGRDSTFNNMVAIGPDFKQGFADAMPVSNADIAPTIAHVLGLDLPSVGKLRGRVLVEALAGGPDTLPFRRASLVSAPTAAGFRTVLTYQELQGRRYFDSARFEKR
ncbi:MAG TPA: alkaline phosphatase family protein [Steroidobacteraceae bacterium]|nr:alkaline phosphatase family protein [Steroidobacteraceae bacterium]